MENIRINITKLEALQIIFLKSDYIIINGLSIIFYELKIQNQLIFKADYITIQNLTANVLTAHLEIAENIFLNKIVVLEILNYSLVDFELTNYVRILFKEFLVSGCAYSSNYELYFDSPRSNGYLGKFLFNKI